MATARGKGAAKESRAGARPDDLLVGLSQLIWSRLRDVTEFVAVNSTRKVGYADRSLQSACPSLFLIVSHLGGFEGCRVVFVS